MPCSSYSTLKNCNKTKENFVSLRAAVRPPYNHMTWPSYPGVGEPKCTSGNCSIYPQNNLPTVQENYGRCPCKSQSYEQLKKYFV